MKRQLELAALGLGITGWLCAILTRCLPLWKVSDGVWLEWDHWDLNHDGSLHCSFYQSLGLIMACIGAVVISIIGEVWFPNLRCGVSPWILSTGLNLDTAGMLGQQHSLHEKMQSGMIRYE
uniref:Uncharacterized protein n=1 Tax=Salmo trutta TaxID=8032 RepID=A0A674EHA0_SALTR